MVAHPVSIERLQHLRGHDPLHGHRPVAAIERVTSIDDAIVLGRGSRCTCANETIVPSLKESPTPKDSKYFRPLRAITFSVVTPGGVDLPRALFSGRHCATRSRRGTRELRGARRTLGLCHGVIARDRRR